MKSKFISIVLVSIFLLVNQLVTAQCSMCRAVVESDISGKGTGLNNGIVYLMTFPYALIVVIAFGLVYKMRKDSKESQTN